MTGRGTAVRQLAAVAGAVLALGLLAVPRAGAADAAVHPPALASSAPPTTTQLTSTQPTSPGSEVGTSPTGRPASSDAGARRSPVARSSSTSPVADPTASSRTTAPASPGMRVGAEATTTPPSPGMRVGGGAPTTAPTSSTTGGLPFTGLQTELLLAVGGSSLSAGVALVGLSGRLGRRRRP